jgi:membrane protease YdiL (CAAX protease family)
MLAYIIPLFVMTLLLGTFIYMSERHGLLRSADYFPSPLHRWGAYAWLGTFLLLLTTLTIGASLSPAKPDELESVPFYSLFASHIILLIFLGGWWLLSGRPDIRRYLNLQKTDSFEASLLGIGVGVGGWAATLMIAATIGGILYATGVVEQDVKPSPMIPWMASLPIWQKATIVFMAMTVEEFFFRGWLQKRVGLIFSTIIFAIAHAGYGQPLMLIGITVVSLIIGYTFYRTRNLWPCIIAHGVFDAIQLFVIVPMAVKMLGLESQ